MIDDESAITFTFRQMGSPIAGRFGAFSTVIRFDPAALADASVAAEIAIDSVDTGNRERDSGIKGADWFDVASHPTATFASTGFTSTGGDAYDVAGTLTIRGIAQPVVLPMTIAIDGERATATGSLELDRRAFEIGRGDWASDAAVGYPVILEISVTAVAID